MNKDKNLIDDGFRPDLVTDANFDGIFEVPHVPGPSEIKIPEGMIPFSKLKYSGSQKEFVIFYEHDIKFRDILTATDDYIDTLKQFPGVVNPDPSLYRDMPLTLQITNVYMSRAVGYSLWKAGIYSIVSIGTYGCIRGTDNTHHFKAGLAAMLDYLEPEVVLVYGPMPDSIFGEYQSRTRFIRFDDWTTVKKKEAAFARCLKDSTIVENGEIVGYQTYSDME